MKREENAGGVNGVYYRANGRFMRARKKTPAFKDEDAEREFWSREDTTDYLDWSKAERVTLPNLRPSLRTISLRLPEAMIAELKLLANKRDVPYQSLLKVFLADRIREELSSAKKSTGAARQRGS